jgi:antitoxin component of MazEF toxin-antitoxin module
MSVQRQVTKVGGSLGVLIPRDIAEVMGVESGTPIRLSVVGRQLVIEPADDGPSDAAFQRAHAAVLRKYGPAFKGLADYDQGRGR